MDKINSKEYWDERFEGDWEAYQGNRQTQYFAEVLCALLPDWLREEIDSHGYEICDIGCAEGDSLPVFQKCFPNAKFSGMDFSKKAVEKAQKIYSDFEFFQGDIMDMSGFRTYPVVVCSNVVEHFQDTALVLKRICARASKYALVLVPYREKEGVIAEHEQRFFTKNIPLKVDESHLVFASSMECDPAVYAYEQVLLVYAKDAEKACLADVSEYIYSDRELERAEDQDKQIRERDKQIRERDKQIRERDRQIQEREKQIQMYQDTIARNQANILEAQALCHHFATGKLMRLNHFLFRLKGQLFSKKREDREEFWQWIIGKILKKNRSVGAGVIYNPLLVIDEKLKKTVAYPLANVERDILSCGDNDSIYKSLSQEIQECVLLRNDKYDVVILSVIDYHFRFQRPQHLAQGFVKHGHRVFFVNSTFGRNASISREKDGLLLVDLHSEKCNNIYSMAVDESLTWMQAGFDSLVFSQGIRDAIVIVDYPNWIGVAEYLRNQYGFKVIADYMDDYTGFKDTMDKELKNNAIRLLRNSDKVAVSSSFLFEIASQYRPSKDISIIRNGAEVDHFSKALRETETKKMKKKVGYYGAVAHWFAIDMVCALAEKKPDYEIVIVGEVTSYYKELSSYSNIQLLGEKPYRDLPDYLRDFDVCLIPFDTSTDLIRATNPVKFYEYLGAGKKIVATEIPELMPYRNQYVYMSNEVEQFIGYVELCAEGRDELSGVESSLGFAKENDWNSRFLSFEKLCRESVPFVSVIVLTYNNLELNKKCLESICERTAYPNYELIVVDNASTDGTVEYLHSIMADKSRNIKVIFNAENLGFAKGNNVGIAEAKGDYIILLNNDTAVSLGWMTSMVKHMENDLNLGMCNPVTNSIGNESMIQIRYNSMEEMLKQAYLYTARNMNKQYNPGPDRIPLFATMIRKKVIEDVGLLGEEYKIGMFEDDDYTERVLEKGYKIAILEDSFVHHVNNASFNKLSDEEYKKLFENNKKIFERKWGKKWIMPRNRVQVTSDCNKGTVV